MRNLAGALRQDLAEFAQRGTDGNPDELEKIFDDGMTDVTDMLRVAPLPHGTNLLLVVEQFEEIFRIPNEWRAREVEPFVAQLMKCAEYDAPIYVTISMRSDFFTEAMSLPHFADILRRSQFPVRPFTREELRDAIVNPARVAGREIDPSLVERILTDIAGRSNALPLLQYTLARMWHDALPRSPFPPLNIPELRSRRRYRACAEPRRRGGIRRTGR